MTQHIFINILRAATISIVERSLRTEVGCNGEQYIITICNGCRCGSDDVRLSKNLPVYTCCITIGIATIHVSYSIVDILIVNKCDFKQRLVRVSIGEDGVRSHRSLSRRHGTVSLFQQRNSISGIYMVTVTNRFEFNLRAVLITIIVVFLILGNLCINYVVATRYTGTIIRLT